jgi:hypothetical protein
LLEVMTQREEKRVLEGRIEIDDAYLGGEKAGKRGRGSENKTSESPRNHRRPVGVSHAAMAHSVSWR